MNGLLRLQDYLDSTYPGAFLIPTRECGKIPLHRHKNDQYNSQKFKDQGYRECTYGCMIVLTEGIIVVDVDDEETCMYLEESVDAFNSTVCCKTKKGKHYYFQPTTQSKDAKMHDGARQMKQKTGEVFPIDIKTRNGVISIPPSPNKTWIRKLGEYEMLPIPNRFVDFYTEHTKPRETQIKSKQITTAPLEEVQKLVDMLDRSRAETYQDWIQLGWALHNIDPINLLETWIEFSKQSTKYKQGECERLWVNMRPQGLNIGTLCHWAKQDDPSAYSRYINDSIYTSIKDCNGSHNSVANIAHKILKGKYICATSNGKLWYEFKSTLWQEDKDGIHVRHDLSTIVKEQFRLTMNKVMTSMSIDDMQSHNSSSTNANKQLCEALLRISFKLEDNGFKECVMKEMREYFYDENFLKNVDANPNLIAFDNGVWDLKDHIFRSAKPEDYLSKSVGYDYIPTKDPTISNKVHKYWETLHPDASQRTYFLKTISRQLQGDVGHNLFHVHAGYQGSAGNGKSTMFDILEMCLGDYIRKFGVEMLVAKQRVETGKPMPDFQYWKGVRILYCTEPKHDDTLNTGIMKDLTGGEKIMYRLLYSNEIIDFRPMFKMHIMCNDTPQVDGSDSGVKRRIRKIDYVSQFVSREDVNESQHRYLRDDMFINEIRQNSMIRMEFMRLLLDRYDHDYQYEMPEVIRKNSQMYLEENDGVFKFVQEQIQPDRNGYFTLKEVKDRFKNSEYFNNKIQTLKNDLQKVLKVKCDDQRMIKGKKEKNVFWGYRLISTMDIID